MARLIGAYQARLELQTRSTRPADDEGFSWATTVHRPTTPSDPGRDRSPPTSQPVQPPGQQPPPPRWPYSGPGGPQARPGSQAVGGQYPEPRGYRSGHGVAVAQPADYPQPDGTRSHGATARLPASMMTAVRLMYAGAAYALVWAIGTIAVAASIVRQHPVVDDHRLSGAVTLAILVGAAEIALWLGIARACRRGSKGARVAGTVLFALHTLGVLGVLGSSQAGLGPAKALTLIGWLIGLGAVVALWQRPSSAFFSARSLADR